MAHAQSTTSDARTRPDAEGLRVLIGPSYLELGAIQQIDWGAATVRYFKKDRGQTEPDAWKKATVDYFKQRPKRPVRESDFIYYDAESIAQGVDRAPMDGTLADVILQLGTDASCFLMAERDRHGMFVGALLAPVQIADCARYAWACLRDFCPDVLIFHNAPHEVFTYALLKLALRLKIPTFLVHYSVLPWRMGVSRYSSDASTQVIPIKAELTDVERDSIRQYMKRLQGSHDGAMPAVDRKFISGRRGDLYFGAELRAAFRGSMLKNLVRIVLKWALYRDFTRFVKDEVKRPYVVFLMHYQPEESTIPRGGIYAQQLNAILKLRAVLPDAVSIVVKENRATFRTPLTLAISVRSREYYRAIASLPSTGIVPMGRDTFNLVDNSLAVATISGSVGVEALCRGKPVIVFGNATYKNFAGVTRLDELDAEGADLGAVVDGAGHDPAKTEKDLLAELKNTMGAEVEGNETNFQSQQIATVEAFSYLAKNLGQLMRRSATS